MYGRHRSGAQASEHHHNCQQCCGSLSHGGATCLPAIIVTLSAPFWLTPGSVAVLRCKDCPHWYGGEDYGYGSCRLKLQRDEQRFLTFGQQECDEGVDPDIATSGEGDD